MKKYRAGLSGYGGMSSSWPGPIAKIEEVDPKLSVKGSGRS